MKKFSVLLVFIFVLKLGWAQNPNLDYKYAIKMYNLTTYEERLNSINSYSLSSTSLQILHPTIAFQWTSGKKNHHELELTNFGLGLENNITMKSISVRYEYIINFNKNADKKMVPAIGFAASPYFSKKKSELKTSNQFLYSEVYIGTKLYVVPRLTFFVSPRVFLDLNIPICVSDVYYNAYKIEDPTLQPEEANTLNVDIFPMAISGRIGVGIKL